MIGFTLVQGSDAFEFGSERVPRGLLRGKRANAKRYFSLRIEDSPQLAAENLQCQRPCLEKIIYPEVRINRDQKSAFLFSAM